MLWDYGRILKVCLCLCEVCRDGKRADWGDRGRRPEGPWVSWDREEGPQDGSDEVPGQTHTAKYLESKPVGDGRKHRVCCPFYTLVF